MLLAQLTMNNLDLLFRVCYLCGLKGLQVADVTRLEVFDSSFVAWIETVYASRQLKVRRQREAKRVLGSL